MTISGRHGGVMGSALVSGSSNQILSPGRGHNVVFSSFHRAFINNGTGELNTGNNPVMD